MSTSRLIAVGDIFLQTGNSKHPFENVKQILKSKDILFGNLETVLSSRGKEAEKAVLLYTSPEKVSYLKEAGFDVLNVANNHIMDLGVDGFNETLDVLNRNNLIFIGAGNQKFPQSWRILEKNGIKIGFFGYYEAGFNDTQNGIFINKIDEKRIIADIESLKSQCDAVILALHWGIEKVFYPSPAQIKLARRLIDAGATVILGHHPHVIQGVERYKHGLIAYSLGNFQFEFNPLECYGKKNKRTNWSIILSLGISKNGLEAYDIIPVKIDEDFVPCLASEQEQKEIRYFVSEISQPLNNGKLTKRWWFEQIAEEYLSGNMKSFIIRIKRYGIKHFLQCIKWLVSPFVIRCYIGFLTRKLKGE